MNQPATTRSKSQTLSLRLDPKTRFILDFVSRVRGQTITLVVERAIKEEADRVEIGPSRNHNNNELPQDRWSDFWDPDEGVRTLKLIAHSHYPTSLEEDEIRRFTLEHWEFFYTTREGTIPRRAYVNILWPRIDKYLEIWREKKTTDYWAAGELMVKDLSAARIEGPQWPRTSQKSTAPRRFSRDLDDEVPF